MELRQLQYFVAAARHRHVTRAAEALHVTQPALSQQIRRLEAELGVALLHRTPKGVEPTAAGAELLERAERILADVAGLRAGMDAHAGALRGIVRVAARSGDDPGLPAALAGFGAEHPGVGIALRHAEAREVEELLRLGALDVAIVGGPSAPSGPVPPDPAPPGVVLREEGLRLLVPAGDPLANAGPVSLGDVRDRAFVLAEEGSALRQLALDACAGAGFGPVPRFAVGDRATVARLVAEGLGVALAPASWAGGDVAAVVVAEDPGPWRTTLLLAPEPSPAAVAAHAWLADRLAED
jgi:DNA-binding transcriptional LysR family regulator